MIGYKHGIKIRFKAVTPLGGKFIAGTIERTRLHPRMTSGRGDQKTYWYCIRPTGGQSSHPFRYVSEINILPVVGNAGKED